MGRRAWGKTVDTLAVTPDSRCPLGDAIDGRIPTVAPIESRPVNTVTPGTMTAPFPPLGPGGANRVYPERTTVTVGPDRGKLAPGSCTPRANGVPFEASGVDATATTPLPPVHGALITPKLPRPLIHKSNDPRGQRAEVTLRVRPRECTVEVVPNTVTLVDYSILGVHIRQ